MPYPRTNVNIKMRAGKTKSINSFSDGSQTQSSTVSNKCLYGTKNWRHDVLRINKYGFWAGVLNSWTAGYLYRVTAFGGSGYIEYKSPWAYYKVEGELSAADGTLPGTFGWNFKVIPQQFFYPEFYKQGDPIADSRAILKAHEKLIQGQEEVQGFVSLGELKETVELLTKPLKTACKYFKKYQRNTAKKIRRELKRKRSMSPAHASKIASDNWLQYRYAIAPAVMEANAYMAILRKGFESFSYDIRHTRACAVVENHYDVFDNIGQLFPFQYWPNYWTSVNIQWHGTQRVTRKSCCDIWWRETEFGRWTKEMRSLGMGLENIPGSAWELLTLSFVIDWFIDVGTWLNATVPKPSIEVKGSCLTVKTTNEYNLIPRLAAPNAYVKTKIDPFYGKTEYIARTDKPAVPATPVLGTGWTALTRQLDALSLLRNLVPKFFSRK